MDKQSEAIGKSIVKSVVELRGEPIQGKEQIFRDLSKHFHNIFSKAIAEGKESLYCALSNNMVIASMGYDIVDGVAKYTIEVFTGLLECPVIEIRPNDDVVADEEWIYQTICYLHSTPKTMYVMNGLSDTIWMNNQTTLGVSDCGAPMRLILNKLYAMLSENESSVTLTDFVPGSSKISLTFTRLDETSATVHGHQLVYSHAIGGIRYVPIVIDCLDITHSSLISVVFRLVYQTIEFHNGKIPKPEEEKSEVEK